MNRRSMISISLVPFVSVCALALGAPAFAVCTADVNKTAYGDFFVRRQNETCDCSFYMPRYQCGKTGNAHRYLGDVWITTVPGDCSKSCENLSGYDAAVALAATKWLPGPGGYDCDTTVGDFDQDGLGACLDEHASNPRVGVRACVGSPTCTEIAEKLCDGVDNDNDGVKDDGIAGCSEDNDHKRIGIRSLYQGDSTSSVNLVDGNLLVHQVDTSIATPYGPLVLARTYNSRRNTNDVGVGIGWTHSFSVYLKQMPYQDGRWRVLTPWGEEQYFFCTGLLSGDQTCVIDDHHPRGNLRRTGGAWLWYPGDGSVYRFSEVAHPTYGRAWDLYKDAPGHNIATATTWPFGQDGYGLIQQVTSANPNIYLYFTYFGGFLDKVRVSSPSVNQILDYDPKSGTFLLEFVRFSETVGSGGDLKYYHALYDASNNLTGFNQRLEASEITTASFNHDSLTDRVLTIQDASKALEIGYVGPGKTGVISAASGGTTETTFSHNGLWVNGADSDIRLGGIPGKSVTYDNHGRMTCFVTDDSRAYAFAYGNSTVPTKRDEYAAPATCPPSGSPAHESWLSWEYNTIRQSWRQKWVRTKSVYNPAASCADATLPAGCRETKYTYVSTTDDRVRDITRTGYTKNVTEAITQQIRGEHIYYYGLDTTLCTSADSYPDLPCRVGIRNASGAYDPQTAYTYVPTGATAGLLKTLTRYKYASVSFLWRTFSGHNVFGSPTSVTDERGMVTNYGFNGWNAVTSMTEVDAYGVGQSPLTQYTYNDLRRIDTVTLPKGNKIRYRYFDSTGFGRLKAMNLADSNGNPTEILRYENDNFGHQTERKIMDSMVGDAPCLDENDPKCPPDTRDQMGVRCAGADEDQVSACQGRRGSTRCGQQVHLSQRPARHDHRLSRQGLQVRIRQPRPGLENDLRSDRSQRPDDVHL